MDLGIVKTEPMLKETEDEPKNQTLPVKSEKSLGDYDATPVFDPYVNDDDCPTPERVPPGAAGWDSESEDVAEPPARTSGQLIDDQTPLRDEPMNVIGIVKPELHGDDWAIHPTPQRTPEETPNAEEPPDAYFTNLLSERTESLKVEPKPEPPSKHLVSVLDAMNLSIFIERDEMDLSTNNKVAEHPPQSSNNTANSDTECLAVEEPTVTTSDSDVDDLTARIEQRRKELETLKQQADSKKRKRVKIHRKSAEKSQTDVAATGGRNNRSRSHSRSRSHERSSKDRKRDSSPKRNDSSATLRSRERNVDVGNRRSQEASTSENASKRRNDCPPDERKNRYRSPIEDRKRRKRSPTPEVNRKRKRSPTPEVNRKRKRSPNEDRRRRKGRDRSPTPEDKEIRTRSPISESNKRSNRSVSISHGLARVPKVKVEQELSEPKDCLVRQDEKTVKVIQLSHLLEAPIVPPEQPAAPLTIKEKRERAVKRVTALLEQFELKKSRAPVTEFLFVDTIHQLPNSTSYMNQCIFENPSPICTNCNVKYKFNSMPGTRFDLEKWGLEAMPPETTELLRITGIDVVRLKQLQLNTKMSQRMVKLKEEATAQAKAVKMEEFGTSLYMNSATQTDGTGAHVRDMGVQAMLSPAGSGGTYWQDPDFQEFLLSQQEANVMYALKKICKKSPHHSLINQLYQSLQPALALINLMEGTNEPKRKPKA